MPATAADTSPLVALSKPPSDAMERLEVKRLVDEAVVAKKLVVVACEVVALRAVKLPKVEEALVRMPPESVESPVTPRVEERVAAPAELIEKRLLNELF